MLIRAFRNNFIAELEASYDRMEAEQFFNLSLEHLCGVKRVDLALSPNLEFSEGQLTVFTDVLQKLKQYVPIQYILGETYFCGLQFTVNQNVLIPRPETEELIDWITSEAKSTAQILDIGTGSGCIAISLASIIKESQVEAWDISASALIVAEINANANNVNVNFKKVDVLAAELPKREYDIIVSNPPYVRELEKHEIAPNVLEHEPHLALFVKDHDPLLFYRAIAVFAKRSLRKNGSLYFEINQYLSREMVEMLSELGFSEIQLRKDFYGNDRMIRCSYS